MSEELEKRLAKLIREIGEGGETAFEVVEDLTEDGQPQKRLVVERRKLQAEPVIEAELARSPRRAHVLQSVGAFAAYLVKYGGAKTVVLADLAAHVFKAVLDETAPRGFECIRFEPSFHPLFEAWRAVLNHCVKLDAFVRFVLYHRSEIEGGKALALSLQKIRISRKTEAYKGLGNECQNGVMVTLRLDAGERTELCPIPDEIVVNIPIFVGRPAEALVLQLTVDDGGEEAGPVLHVAVPDLEGCIATTFEQMLDEIRAELSKMDCVVGLGAVGHAPWEIVR